VDEEYLHNNIYDRPNAPQEGSLEINEKELTELRDELEQVKKELVGSEEEKLLL
jgi:hypothetical protein